MRSFLRAAVPRLAAACALAALGLVDLWLGEFSGQGGVRLPWAVAAVAVALCADRPGPRGLPVLAVAQAAGAAGAWWATRHDQTAGMPFTLSATAALLGVLGLLTWRGDPRWTAVTAPVLAVSVLVQPLRGDGDDLRTAVGVLVLVLGVALAATAGLAARLTAAARTRQLERARAAQRAEFARDLHDFVAHHVTGIVVHAQGAAAVAGRDPELVLPALREIERAGTEAVDAMRRAVGLLRDDDRAPGLAEVPALVERFRRTSGLPGGLDLLGPFADVHPTASTAAYRVVMEALTNAREHARGATAVDVALHRTANGIAIRVTDDGRSVPGHPVPGRPGGFGLRGLRERVAAAGGTLSAGPAPHGGWVVEAGLPVGAGVGEEA
ncbi:sensor histidine kinase [Saccharothrix longispora]|uniref:histidine kinase n=1 Tax=Saccharothrix longispora TaxID=33920 RepID=A0ABU1PMH8_9PSEU|nr:histidine kinase [Saccharothrix longispora]MDR6591867.1 signal transduction histidine kinase [Saccharothrix longispora]